MKIGILSLILHTNYGGILQSYALQTILEQMGHNVIVLDKDRDAHRSAFRQCLTLGKFILSRYFLKKDVEYYNPIKLNRERKEREQNTQAFINKYIHRRRVRRIQSGVLKDVDAIVVGSDQVWRPKYFEAQWKTGIEHAFLKFASSYQIKRIAYAPSFGTEVWEFSEEKTIICSKLLQVFDAVSVRETSAIDLCRNKLCRNNVIQTLDPTLLLSKEDYEQLIESAEVKKSPGNLLCYILDNSKEKQKLVERIAKERHLVPFNTNSKIGNPDAPQKDRIQPPVEQWIRSFMDAEFVVTDSFHACVFSIIFEKPFVVIANEERGTARYKSLFSMLSLEHHLLNSTYEYDSCQSYTVNEKAINSLKNLKNTSMAFLQNALK